MAELAGVSPALIIRYFKSKDERVSQTIMRGLTPQGNAETAEHAQDGAFKTYCDPVGYLLETDMGNAPRTKDLMTMAWWWMEAEELTSQNAL